MGTFMKKEELEAYAREYGIDLDGLTWPQKQAAVLKARSEAGDDIQYGATSKHVPKMGEVVVHKGKRVHGSKPADAAGRKVLISPEILPTPYQFVKYDEELLEDIEIEEMSLKDEFEQGKDVLVGKDLNTGTYRIKGRNGRKVIAQSTIPKENAKITFQVGVDLVPVVEFMGRRGYLWTHHRLPNVKDLLLKSGYYEEYKDRFKDEPYIWHSAGKLLTCDITMVEAIFKDIERKEREKRHLYGRG